MTLASRVFRHVLPYLSNTVAQAEVSRSALAARLGSFQVRAFLANVFFPASVSVRCVK